ncbi:MAG: hydroxyacylglutathione hydrolase [Mariprofundaceae bacterium]|nr:hydroxyacylglutathione hydrolase [Mariprofundaceae bacterium]
MWTYQHQNFCVHQLPALKDNYIYLIETKQHLLVVDPTDAELVINASKQLNKAVTHILNTHHHWDHTDGNHALKQHFGCQVISSEHDAYRTPDYDMSATPSMLIHDLVIQSIDVPGHTLGHINYLIDDALFTGDTLFGAGCGRLFEGTPTMMWASLEKLAALNPATQVYCAHEYTLMNLRFARTLDENNDALQERIHSDTRKRMQKIPTIPSNIALECATNPFLRPLHTDFCQNHANTYQTESTPLAVFTDLRQRRDCYS